MRHSSHAIKDEESRRLKAKQILTVITEAGLPSSARILDVGTGSGHIARFLMESTAHPESVSSIDVADERETDGFDFTLVTDTTIPFDSETFDVVISNHVIEHVPGKREQVSHLAEIARVLKPGGLLYIATPNKWFPWESHFQLPLLSYFPQPVASLLLRILRKASFYDCVPLSPRELKRLLQDSGFSHLELRINRIAFLQLQRLFPQIVVTALEPFVYFLLLLLPPTSVFIARKPQSEISF